ncbi:MAG TPA: hypothetical protein PKJ08_12515, partial [Candidatus Cloacimonadota bacterium]|nr:hypothetical protein [Candidatus Cloacimonadota bacterium]
FHQLSCFAIMMKLHICLRYNRFSQVSCRTSNLLVTKHIDYLKLLIFYVILFCSMYLYADEVSLSVSKLHRSQRGFPLIQQMTKLSTSPINEKIPDFLDIRESYFAYSDKKIYGLIQNREGGFPFHSKMFTEYYSYMFVIASNKDEGTVWAMTYINVPMVGFKPGLYRIKGRGKNDLKRIADISFEIDQTNNRLKMSCQIADLIADPLFTTHFTQQHPIIGIAVMTNKTNVFPYKTQSVDSTYPGSRINLKNLWDNMIIERKN